MCKSEGGSSVEVGIGIYYVDTLLEYTPLRKFTRNYIMDPTRVFSISSVVIFITSLRFFHGCFVFIIEEITWWLEDTNFILSIKNKILVTPCTCS